MFCYHASLYLTVLQVNRVLAAADLDGDGVIDYKEFVPVATQLLQHNDNGHAAEDAADKPAGVEAAAGTPVEGGKPTAGESAANNLAAEETPSVKPTAEKTPSDKATADNPGVDKPRAEKAGTADKPVAEQPASNGQMLPGRTVLSAPATAGDTILHVLSNDGFQAGTCATGGMLSLCFTALLCHCASLYLTVALTVLHCCFVTVLQCAPRYLIVL